MEKPPKSATVENDRKGKSIHLLDEKNEEDRKFRNSQENALKTCHLSNAKKV